MSNLVVPAASTPALRSLIADTLDYASASRSPATIRQYTSNWAGFLAFGEKHALPSLPTSVQVVAVYLTSLANAGKAVSTVLSHLAAVKYFSQQSRHVIDWRDPIISQVLSGIQRSSTRRVHKAAALLTEDMTALVEAPETRLNGLRDKAIMLIGFAGAFRRSEITGLNVENIEYASEGIVLYLAQTKTDQERKGSEVSIPYAKNPDMCPVLALQAWLGAAKITSGPVFRRIRKGGAIGTESLSEESIRLILAKRVIDAGHTGSFTPHSLRAGFCTQSALNGNRIEQIGKQARHADPRTTLGYIRVAERFTNHAGANLL